MGSHVDTEAVELDAFGLEAHALFETSFTGEKNFAVGTDDAVPWEPAGRGMKCPSDLARRAGISGGVSDISIGGDLATWDATDLRKDFGEHGAGHGEEDTTKGHRVIGSSSHRVIENPNGATCYN